MTRPAWLEPCPWWMRAEKTALLVFGIFALWQTLLGLLVSLLGSPAPHHWPLMLLCLVLIGIAALYHRGETALILLAPVAAAWALQPLRLSGEPVLEALCSIRPHAAFAWALWWGLTGYRLPERPFGAAAAMGARILSAALAFYFLPSWTAGHAAHMAPLLALGGGAGLVYSLLTARPVARFFGLALAALAWILALNSAGMPLAEYARAALLAALAVVLCWIAALLLMRRRGGVYG